MARHERMKHMQLYPGWSARDNYGVKKKRTIKGTKRDKQSTDTTGLSSDLFPLLLLISFFQNVSIKRNVERDSVLINNLTGANIASRSRSFPFAGRLLLILDVRRNVFVTRKTKVSCSMRIRGAKTMTRIKSMIPTTTIKWNRCEPIRRRQRSPSFNRIHTPCQC
jgi:hypothetical protein